MVHTLTVQRDLPHEAGSQQWKAIEELRPERRGQDMVQVVRVLCSQSSQPVCLHIGNLTSRPIASYSCGALSHGPEPTSLLAKTFSKSSAASESCPAWHRNAAQAAGSPRRKARRSCKAQRRRAMREMLRSAVVPRLAKLAGA